MTKEEMSVLKLGEKVLLDSSLVHQDSYLYNNIVKDSVYVIDDIAKSAKHSILIQIRDAKNIARWVDAVYFRVRPRLLINNKLLVEWMELNRPGMDLTDDNVLCELDYCDFEEFANDIEKLIRELKDVISKY